MIRHLMRQQYRVTKQHVLPLDRAPHLFLRYRLAQLPQHEPALRRIFLFRYRQHVRASPSVAVRRALVEDRQHPLQLVPPPARQARYLDDVAAVMDALHQRVARLQLPPRAPLGHSRADVDHRLVRRAQVVAQKVDGHDRHRLGAARRMGEDVSGAANLLSQAAPEVLEHGRRLGLPDLDQHLQSAAVLGLHAGREVHAQQRQRHMLLLGLRRAAHGGLRAGGERLHRQAGDPADQEAGGAAVLHQVPEHHVVDRVGDLHAGIGTCAPRAGQSPSPGWTDGVAEGDGFRRTSARLVPNWFLSGSPYLRRRRPAVVRIGGRLSAGTASRSPSGTGGRRPPSAGERGRYRPNTFMSSINSVSIFLGILRFLIMSLMFDLTTRRVLQSGQLSCGSLIDGILHEAQRSAEERNEGPDARYRVRINFDNILRLAHADRTLGGRWQPGRYRRRCDSYGIEWRLPESKSGSSTVAARSGVSRIRPTEYSSSACSKTLSTTTATRASSSC